MNTYYISADVYKRNSYVVEADSRDEAIYEVESGGVDPEESEYIDISDVSVDDVDYGDIEYAANLSLTFVIRGEAEGNDVKELLWDVLASCDGKTTERDDSTIELVGFNVENVEKQ